MTSSAVEWSALIGIMVLGVVLLLSIAGITLFILGMVRKRRGLWIVGLVLGLPGLTLLGLCAMAAWGYSTASVPPQAMLVGGAARVSARRVVFPTISTTDELVAWFRESAGVELPEGVQLVDADVTGRSAGGQMPDIFTSSVMKVTVGESFGSFIQENFRKAAMEDVKDRMRAGEADEPAFWRDGADLRMRYFSRTCTDSMHLDVAYDEEAGVAYLARSWSPIWIDADEVRVSFSAPATVNDPAQEE